MWRQTHAGSDAPAFRHGRGDAAAVTAGTPYRASRNVVCSCKHHVVWCPKYRRPVLDEEAAERLKALLRRLAQECQAELIGLEVVPDHVHLLCEVAPQFGIHRLVRRLKGRSSRLLRQEFPRLRSRLPTLWTNSYFVATVGGAPLAAIRRYIEQQRGR